MRPVRRPDSLATFMCPLSQNLPPQPPGTLRVCNRHLKGLLYFYSLTRKEYVMGLNVACIIDIEIFIRF